MLPNKLISLVNMHSTSSIYTVLLVEHNPADILLIEEMLESITQTTYKIIFSQTLKEAIEIIKVQNIDAILLDLDLPDVQGVQTIKKISSATSQIPIIVVTHLEDEEVAFQCIQEGVQDYLIKGRIDSVSLRLAISYAVLRNRDAEIEEFKNVAENNLSLSSESKDSDTFENQGSIKLQNPEYFKETVSKYSLLLDSYVEDHLSPGKKPKQAMQEIISSLADKDARSEDLLDIHISALEYSIANKDIEITHKFRQEGQFFALEMMGMLANHYRSDYDS